MILDAHELKQRYIQRISGVRDRKVYIGPEAVTLEINNTCNLSCRFCWTHAPGNPAHYDKPNQMSWEKFTGIIDDAEELKVDQMILIGSGEPTMHPKFREMTAYLEHRPFYTKVNTNAAFAPEYCDDLIKLDHAIINFSAVNPEQYIGLKGKDFFDRAVANIRRLVHLRDTIKPAFHIEIACIVNAINANYTQEMKQLATDLKVDTLFFEKMNVHAYNRDIALPENSDSEIAGEDRLTPPECLHGWFYMVLKPEDEASICCRIKKMHLGNLSHFSFKTFWHSQHLMNVRLMGKHGILQKRHQACTVCPFYEKNIKRMQDAINLEANAKACS